MKIPIVKWLVNRWRKRQERLEMEKANVKRWERLLGSCRDSDDSDDEPLGRTSTRPEPYLLPEPTEYRDSGHSGRIDNTPRLKRLAR